jgi:hypothetical protein
MWHISIAANLIRRINNNLQDESLRTDSAALEATRSSCCLPTEKQRTLALLTTRFLRLSASTLAISRITVVFPTPGLPRNSMELGTEDTPAAIKHRTCLTLSVNECTGSGGSEQRTIKDVADHVNMSCDGTSHATGQAHNCALAIPHGADAMQRSLHARPIVTPEIADGVLSSPEVIPSYLRNGSSCTLNTSLVHIPVQISNSEMRIITGLQMQPMRLKIPSFTAPQLRADILHRPHQGIGPLVAAQDPVPPVVHA